ncbi:hypothetical protein [Lactococcus taiwanensis]|uniref:hypothetical protein n=1 Tax=Lactococcus taiwanensis TaxID=1151742 RepID=UPI0028A5F19D|nr:hypothetical protein [Lactococcus taiwanensis]
MSKTWLVLATLSTGLYFYGKLNYDEFFTFIGAVGIVGALTCGLTGLIIKALRNVTR